jgi:hypothetical protein
MSINNDYVSQPRFLYKILFWLSSNMTYDVIIPSAYTKRIVFILHARFTVQVKELFSACNK